MKANYPQVLGKVLKSFWAITEERHYAILSALEARLSGCASSSADRVSGEDCQEDQDQFDRYCEVIGEYGITAVIPVHGILGKHLSAMEMDCGGCSLDRVAAFLESATSSPRIGRIVLNIGSPGGTVTGTPELAAKIAEARKVKPVVAFTDTEACSGALWIGSQADQFWCTESASVGSVGVRMILMECSAQLDREGIKVNPIFSGKFKLAGASFKPLTPEEREMFQSESDRIYADFKAAVTSVRGCDDVYLQGQVFRGEEATRIGMVTGTVDDLDMVLDMPFRAADR